MASQTLTCQNCTFWASGAGKAGHCKRNAPRPTEAVDQIAYWPETFAADWCGEAQARTELPSTIRCEACAFWSRVGLDGIFPIDRLGARTDWWREAGHCVRHAPAPSSDGGQRGFWRATHKSDGCAEGRPVR